MGAPGVEQAGRSLQVRVQRAFVEGRHSPLAKLGYSRVGTKGTVQIEYGLVTGAEGCPVAVEVQHRRSGHRRQSGGQAQGPLRAARCGAGRRPGDADLGADRGVEGDGRHRVNQRPAQPPDAGPGRGWRAPAVDLRRAQPRRDHRPAYPGERLVVCKNPLLAAERTRKREDRLAATEARLGLIAERVAGGQLRGAAAIGLRVGRVLNTHKVGRHFDLQITDTDLVVRRKQAEITAEAALDGIYMLRTSVVEERLDSAAVVRAYKRPSTVERAWAPLLYRDEDRPIPEDPVAPAQRLPAAQRKASTQRLDDSTPVHSLCTLLADLATLACNRMAPSGVVAAAFEVVTTSTPLQDRALGLLNLTATSLS